MIWAKFGPRSFKISPNYSARLWPIAYKSRPSCPKISPNKVQICLTSRIFLPKWRNFATSGHTAGHVVRCSKVLQHESFDEKAIFNELLFSGFFSSRSTCTRMKRSNTSSQRSKNVSFEEERGESFHFVKRTSLFVHFVKTRKSQ